MKVLVMGAGAVGGYLGGRLAQQGHEVVLVARGTNLDALRAGPLNVSSDHGDFELSMKATDNPADVGVADLVLFAVKSYDTHVAARQLAPVVGPNTAILSIQNGVDNEELLASLYGAEKVLGGVIYIEANLASPAHIEQPSARQDLVFGEWVGPRTPRARRIETMFREAGINVTLVDDVQPALWRKFIFICAFSGITALTRSPIGPIRDSTPTWSLYTEALREAYRVGRARGVALPHGLAEELIDFTLTLPGTMRSSLQGDLEKGKPLELDALNGTVMRLGDELNVDVPVNRCIYRALALYAEP